ncbi:MAG: alpha/beta hydrolase [bacterium]|nr:alpha/beta hydrolase [bacterium]
MSAFPDARMIQSNGIRMAVYERGEGLPVVFSHGFPELAYSWRHQVDALAGAGYRAIAPDQRGYGATDRPPRIEDYDLVHLTGDLIGLLDALEIEKAVFCGHDWGGIVTWQLPLLHPDRVAGLIGVNTPFLPRGPAAPIELMRQTLGGNFYIVHFQKPGEADVELASDVPRVFEALMRKLDPAELDTGAPVRNMVEIVRAEPMRGTALLSSEDMDVYIRAFEASGFTGGINWYRNLDRNWELTAGVEQLVTAPGLMLSAADDLALPPSLADGMEAYVPNLEKHLIPGCGHWSQQEKPDEINALIIDWLKRTFPDA